MLVYTILPKKLFLNCFQINKINCFLKMNEKITYLQAWSGKKKARPEPYCCLREKTHLKRCKA